MNIQIKIHAPIAYMIERTSLLCYINHSKTANQQKYANHENPTLPMV